MPKAKTKTKEKTSWRHVHKIKVHHNRWLAWTIAIAILACASLVAYIQVSDINFQTTINAENSLGPNWSSFTHRAENYSVKYPKSWGVEAETGNSINFVNGRNPNDYFSVTPYAIADEKTLRTSLFTGNLEAITVNGVLGIRLSQGRNQPEHVVMLKDSSRVYVLRGKGDSFNRILSTFKLNEKLERI